MTRNSPRGLLAAATERLRAAGIEEPRREARLLLAHALDLDQAGLLSLDPLLPVPPERFEALLRRRCRREPMALILGRCGFWSLELEVSADTLIPRADSETLVEAVLRRRPDRDQPLRVLDLGTGTGCLLLAVLAERPQAFGVGIDRSAAAAALAGRNAARNGLGARAAFLCGNWASAIGAAGFDLVLSNPPYIPAGALAGLMPEVRAFEPATALDGGADGLDGYRAILPSLRRLLRPGGLAAFEVGADQAAPVRALAGTHGLEDAGVATDLGGVDRVVLLGG